MLLLLKHDTKLGVRKGRDCDYNKWNIPSIPFGMDRQSTIVTTFCINSFFYHGFTVPK
jgi:hypothetical protein